MPDIQSMGEYKEQVTDEQLINMIENGVQNSVGDWLLICDLFLILTHRLDVRHNVDRRLIDALE